MSASTRHPDITDDAIDRFWQRYEWDDADGMTEDQWGDWVDALPRDEFLAMIHIGLSEDEEAA